MTTIEPPRPLPRGPARSRGRPAARGLRIVVALALAGLAGLLIYFQEQFRHIEALVMSEIFSPFSRGLSSAVSDIFFVRGPGGWMGFRITVEYTTLVLIVPILILAALLVAFPKRTTWPRWLFGLTLGILIVSTVNVIRLSMIAVATLHLGHVGYEWAHIVLGGVFALLGCVATLVLMLRPVGVSRGRRRSTPIPR